MSIFAKSGFLFGCLWAMGCGQGPATPSSGTERKGTVHALCFAVELGARCGTTEGLPWPNDGSNALSETATVGGTAEVLVMRGGQILLSSRSRATIMRQNGGIVDYVKIMPLPEAVSLPEAMNSLRKVLTGISDERATNLSKELERVWKAWLIAVRLRRWNGNPIPTT